MTFNEVLHQLIHNRLLGITLLSWIIAQTIKVMVGIISERRFNFKWFIGTGGMPSSHASGVTTLAVCVGMESGFASPLFAVAAVIAMVIMFDAQGVRYATGKQASILNKMMDDLYWKGHIEEERLKELIGHTPVQVLMGCLLGLLLGMTLY